MRMEDPSDWTVVVVDDEQDIREVVFFILDDAGYDVHTAGDGEAGVNLCREISPQVVITDIRMPGMDGIQLLETLKREMPGIEVIVMTAFGELAPAVRALRLDASDFITKPLGEEVLFTAIDRARTRFLQKRQVEDHARLLEQENARSSMELERLVSYRKHLVEGSMDGILGVDETGIIVVFNGSMEKILGHEKKDVLNKLSLNQLFPGPELKKLHEFASGPEEGTSCVGLSMEIHVTGKKGNPVPVMVSAQVLCEKGDDRGIVYFFRDLSEVRKLSREVETQKVLLHQDKMISLGHLAASVVHEINNPLSGILNYLRLMGRILSSGPLSEERRLKFREYLELVESETERCSGIVSGLLSFSRRSHTSMEEVNLRELVGRSASLTAHRLELARVKLSVAFTGDIPAVTGDFNQLQQCLINLILNGADAMPGGGEMLIEVKNFPEKAEVLISVRDTGTGIAEGALAHLFEPFFTTREEGLGLGLSTVKEIMERHRGWVSARNREEGGAEFTLGLPV